MGRNWEEGELFVWGDDGLVPADSQEKAVRSAAEPARALPLETPPVRRSEEPAVRRVGRSSGLGEIVTGVDEASGIVRTAPKVLPRRQRSTYESDDDFCNDPEELESRQAQKKAARPKKERPSLFVRAIGSLARREYSRRDLEAKLRRSLSEDEDPDEVGRVLDRLEGAGYLSDARFAESRARSRSRVMGDARIRRELRQCGVAGRACRCCDGRDRGARGGQGLQAVGKALWRVACGQEGTRQADPLHDVPRIRHERHQQGAQGRRRAA